MSKIWVELADIPAEGREFSFADQGFWKESLEAFGLRTMLARPLTAEVTVLPQDNGALVRGRLAGGLLGPGAEHDDMPAGEPVGAIQLGIP